MSIYLAIAAGGAVGAISRYWMTGSVGQMLGFSFPFGTLSVNVLGSFLMGLFAILLTEKIPLDDSVRLGLITGMLGAFTTFSAFAMDTLGLMESGAMVKTLVYVMPKKVICQENGSKVHRKLKRYSLKFFTCR